MKPAIEDQRPLSLPRSAFKLEALEATQPNTFALYDRPPVRRSWFDRLLWWRGPRSLGKVTVDGEGLTLLRAGRAINTMLWKHALRVSASVRLTSPQWCELALKVQRVTRQGAVSTLNKGGSVAFRVLLPQSAVSRRVEIKDSDAPFLSSEALKVIWPLLCGFAELHGQHLTDLIAPEQTASPAPRLRDAYVIPTSTTPRARVKPSNRAHDATIHPSPGFGDIVIGVSRIEDALHAFGDDGFLYCYHCDGFGADKYPWGNPGEHRIWALSYQYDEHKQYKPSRPGNASRPHSLEFDSEGVLKQMDFGVYQHEVTLEGRRLGCGAKWSEVEAVFGALHTHKPGGDVLDTRIYPKIGLRFYVSQEGVVNSFMLLTPEE